MTEVEHTLALGNQEKCRASLQLLDDHVVRLQQSSLHPRHDGLNDNVLGLADRNFGVRMIQLILFRDLHARNLHL